jgi:uncharacterized membrane protein YkoI
MGGFLSRLSASALAVLVLVAMAVGADDEKKSKKVDVDKVPKKVMAAVKARFPGAKITSVEKETTDGKVIYDIELTHKDRKYEMDIQEDGTVLEIEKEVKNKDVLEKVTKAIKAKYPGATVKVVMEVNKVKDKKETPDHYEADILTADKKKMEIVVSLDGKSVKKEGEK